MSTDELADDLAAKCSTGGIMLNGSPPPVESNYYRRHRVRVKEVMANEGRSISTKQSRLLVGPERQETPTRDNCCS